MYLSYTVSICFCDYGNILFKITVLEFLQTKEFSIWNLMSRAKYYLQKKEKKLNSILVTSHVCYSKTIKDQTNPVKIEEDKISRVMSFSTSLYMAMSTLMTTCHPLEIRKILMGNPGTPTCSLGDTKFWPHSPWPYPQCWPVGSANITFFGHQSQAIKAHPLGGRCKSLCARHVHELHLLFKLKLLRRGYCGGIKIYPQIPWCSSI